MPSIAVKLHSVFFKLHLNHRLQSLTNSSPYSNNNFGITSRPEQPTSPANPSFSPDGVATKDLHIDPLTSLSLRIFLPNSFPPEPHTHQQPAYRGYLPAAPARRNPLRLPVILQFHGGGLVSGSNTSPANDFFCRRIARSMDAIVIAVGYRLAPESRYPAAFEDGIGALHWLAKQGNLAEWGRSMWRRRVDVERYVGDAFGASEVEPWLAAHADLSRCVLLGVSCGANIADFVARKALEAGKLLDPVKIVAQVLMCPFFIGSSPTRSEIKLANAYFYDKAACVLAWKLFLPEGAFSLDHPAANPLVPGRGPPLKSMPPTLTVVAEHDWMRDRAIAYSEELRRANVDAPVLEYKDTVHEFATLDGLLKTPTAQACADDIAIWVKKYISTRGHEFSY